MPSSSHPASPPATASPASARGSRTAPPDEVRYAVVGLGNIAQTAVLPGIQQARHSCIAALVSDDPVKLQSLSATYKVERCLPYAEYDALLSSGAIDAVYLTLPNDLHYDYAMRAMRAGIHVLVEKPMAVTAAQCREMNAQAAASGVKLMVAYRLHFESANLTSILLTEQRKLGDVRFFTSTFSMQVASGDIRTRDLSTGGGPLYDLGVYCINAARYLFKAEPVEVMALSASSADPRFSVVDEMLSVIMRFPEARLATFTVSFGASSTAAYDLVGTHGSLRVDPAYEYEQQLQHTLTVHGNRKQRTFPLGDQFAAEVDAFSTCIREDREPEPSGAEGLADILVIEAIIASAKARAPVSLSAQPGGLRRPRPDQERQYPARKQPTPVHAPAPHQET